MAEHNFTVATRVRPLNQREKDSGSVCCVEVKGEEVIIHSQDPACKPLNFAFDQSYWSCDSKDANFVGQARLFTDIGERVVQCGAEGYNSCVFSYGQTGSGKTHTMMGSDAEPGLIPRICRALLEVVQRATDSGVTHRVTLSYLEIYNERIRDLLYDQSDAASRCASGRRDARAAAANTSMRQQVANNLKIRRSASKGVHVPDLTHVLVASYEEVEELLRVGNARRSTAGTRVSAQSSRSHAVLTLTCSQARLTENIPNEITSKLHLVDLAGSERVKVTGATGDRLTEGRHINRSLSTLSKVLYTLSEGGKAAAHVPYRDSLLTQLLQDSLGGNSKTFMIATISPASQNYNESLSTLRYASRAKRIVNKPTVNEDPNVKLIRELRAEIESLQAQLQQQKGIQLVAETEEDLTEKKQQEECLTRRWYRRWAGENRDNSLGEALGIYKELPSPIMDVSRVVKRLAYPDPTDSGINSPVVSDNEDEGLDNSDTSFQSTASHPTHGTQLHDCETTPSPSSSSSSASRPPSSSPKSVSGGIATEPKPWFDRHSTPAARPRPSFLTGTSSQIASESIATQTDLDDHRNKSIATRELDELVEHFSLLENGIDYDITDVSSATDASNFSLMLPGNASARKLALIIEKEVQRRVFMISNGSFNNSVQSPLSSTFHTSPPPNFSSTLPNPVTWTRPLCESPFPAGHSSLTSLAVGCSVPAAGCSVPAAGCSVPAAGCSVPAAGCSVPAAGCSVPAAGCSVPAAGCSVPAAGCSVLAAGCSVPAAGCSVPAAGCSVPAVGCSVPAAGCNVPAAGCNVPAACRPRQRPRSVDLAHEYAVNVSCVYRLRGAPPSSRYYQLDLKAGRESWKVYKKFSDVVEMKTDLEERYPALRSVFERHAVLFSRHEETLKQPSKQELQLLLRDVLALLTEPSSSWSPLTTGPLSQYELRGLHTFFRMGLTDGLRSFMHTITGTVPVCDN